PLSYMSASQLVDRVEILPKPPTWKHCEVKVEGGTTNKPITFYHRDGYESFLFLFGNPLFHGHMRFSPYREFEDDFQKIQLFSEIFSGMFPWRVQVFRQDSVGEGETLGLVMLASDEARLTEHFGDKKTYGVYLSCGNIDKDLRNKLSARCWMKVGEIPVVNFNEKEFQGILDARLAHKCLDIITVNLKKHSRQPQFVPDPAGRIRLLRPILCAHLGDNPEQRKLACVPENSSAVSVADFHKLGSSKPCQPRTTKYTVERIRQLIERLGDNRGDLSTVKTIASAMKLNGVLDPYWIDWAFADPSVFLTPDALHQWHIFFMDHIMDWARNLIEDHEIDKRISVLQRRIGFRTFPTGFTRFKQHTGREERDLQRSFVAIIAGHPQISENIMKAFRGLLDYIYIAQYDSQSTEMLKLLRESLRRFHRNKGYLSRAGIRDGSRQKGRFNIPKLETFHHTPRIIRQVGSAPQFSTDSSEHLHIDGAKDPYKKTNRRNHEEQICRILDRAERILVFNLIVDWVTCKTAKIPMTFFTNPSSVAAHQNRQERLKRFHAMISKEEKYLPRSPTNLFAEDPTQTTKIILKNATTAFSLTARIGFRKRTVKDISDIYHLPALLNSILSFYNVQAAHQLSFTTLDCWQKARIQLHTAQDPKLVAEPYTVAALSPTASLPFGLCNFVLVKQPGDLLYRGIQSGGRSHYVAQLRCIFRPFIRNLPKFHREILAYVEPLKPAPGTMSLQTDGHYDHVPDDNIEMFRLVRDLNPDSSRRGKIIRLTDIWRPIDVIPRFGDECPEEWTRDTSVESATEFYVNSFADKETFQDVY
ncbi:hypothetical protein SCHPADRAFT_839244, partial [Schizopora paradoxa]